MSGHGSLVLGVETSCDDTAVALVDPHGGVIASCVASQTALHTAYGGVYPELASRAHIDKILPTVQAVLSDYALPERVIQVRNQNFLREPDHRTRMRGHQVGQLGQTVRRRMLLKRVPQRLVLPLRFGLTLQRGRLQNGNVRRRFL